MNETNHLLRLIDRIGAGNPNMVYAEMFEIATRIQTSPIIQACSTMLNVMTIMGDVPYNVTTDACTAVPGTPQHANDPCCNAALRQTMCCAATRRVVKVPAIVGYESTQLARCRRPDYIIGVLQKFVAASQRGFSSDSACTEEAKSLMSNDAFSKYTDFLNTCNAKIFGSNGVGSVCKTDADCYTSCVKTISTNDEGNCAIPFDDFTPYIVKCIQENMDPIVQRYLRAMWNISANATEDTFKNIFRQQLQKDSCVGPYAHELIGPGRPEPTQAQCLQRKECNWQRCASLVPSPLGTVAPINYTECELKCMNQKTTNSCMQCYGPACFDRATFARCFRYIDQIPNAGTPPMQIENIRMEIGRCMANGGQLSYEYNMILCNFPQLNSTEKCAPELFCPKFAGGSSQQDVRQCNNICHDPTRVQQNCSSSTPGIFRWWSRHPYISDAGFCNVGAANMNVTVCQAIGGQYVFSRMWVSGMYDTPEKCADGMCNVDPNLNRTECASKWSCSKPCEKCKSGSQQFGTGVCLISGIQSDIQCAQASNNITSMQWDRVASACFTILNRTDCQRKGYQFFSCVGIAAANCTSNVPGMPLAASNLLKCHRDVTCDTVQECVSNGECNDMEMQTVDSTGKTTDRVCVTPFMVNENGYRYCPYVSSTVTVNGVSQTISVYRQSKLGCIDTRAKTPEQCNTANGMWRRRAKTQQECSAYGSVCYEKDTNAISNKNQVECVKCGGRFLPLFNWVYPTASRGAMVPLTWMRREFGAVNEWKKTIDLNRLVNIVNQAVQAHFARVYRVESKCKYLRLLDSIVKVACDCQTFTVAPAACTQANTPVTIGEVKAFSGLESSVQVDLVKLNVKNNTVPPTMSDADISLASVGVAEIAASIPKTTTRQASSSTVNVVNNNGFKIGKLTGDSVSIQFSPSLSQMEVCIKKNINIDPETGTYPDSDLGYANNTALTIWLPVVATVTSNSAIEICAYVSKSGTYAPIQRKTPADYNNLGCDGVAGSNAKADICGVCQGAGTSCLGCDGVAFSGKVKDACNVCGGTGGSCAVVGCDGVLGSGLVKDACGVCGGFSTTCPSSSPVTPKTSPTTPAGGDKKASNASVLQSSLLLLLLLAVVCLL